MTDEAKTASTHVIAFVLLYVFPSFLKRRKKIIASIVLVSLKKKTNHCLVIPSNINKQTLYIPNVNQYDRIESQ